MKATTSRTSFPAVLAIALAGAASMATSPEDDGQVSTRQIDVEAPLPDFTLDDAEPEIVFDVQVTAVDSVGSSTVAGRLTATLDLASDVPAEIIAAIETDEASGGQFTRAPVDGPSSAAINGMVFGAARLRLRMLGSAQIEGRGTLALSVSVPIGTETSTASYTIRVVPR